MSRHMVLFHAVPKVRLASSQTLVFQLSQISRYSPVNASQTRHLVPS